MEHDNSNATYGMFKCDTWDVKTPHMGLSNTIHGTFKHYPSFKHPLQDVQTSASPFLFQNPYFSTFNGFLINLTLKISPNILPWF